MSDEFLVANLTWNPYKWRDLYINQKAGHSYVKTHPGHESLNFDFNKGGIDTDSSLFGYMRWTVKPKRFINGGLIVFYSKNTDTNDGQIIGVYGGVNILESNIIHQKNGFEKNEYCVNVEAKKIYRCYFLGRFAQMRMQRVGWFRMLVIHILKNH